MFKRFRKEKGERTTIRPRGRRSEETQVKRYISDKLALDIQANGDRITQENRKSIERELSRLRSKENRPQSMKYFEEIADFYGKRADEVRKLKKEGKKIIGSLCMLIPSEVIAAADAIPIRLCSGFHECASQMSIFFGEGLCPLSKATLGAKLANASPYSELCDLAVTPTPCDSKLKLGEIFEDFVPTLVLNLPRVKGEEAVRRHWLREIEIMVEELEKVAGAKITVDTLRKAVLAYQKAQHAWRRLCEMRKRGDVLWGRDFLLVAQVSYYDDIQRWTENVIKLCEELEEMQRSGKRIVDSEAPRIMLAGSPIIWPNWKLLDLIEELGAIVACDELCSGTRILYDPVVVDEWTKRGMLSAIAERYLYPCTCPCFSPNFEREDNLLRMIKDYKVEGVIFHVLKSCHLNALDSSKIEILLRNNGTPVLRIESEYNEGDVQQVKTRVEAFLEMIKARRDFPV